MSLFDRRPQTSTFGSMSLVISKWMKSNLFHDYYFGLELGNQEISQK